MSEPNNKQEQYATQTVGHSLKKHLAVATVAASLGVALGVNVGEVLAAETQLSSPPNAVSRQDKWNVSNQHKDTIQKQSTQQKINQSNQSKQIKIDTPTPQTMYGK
jgi:hypothetical protein